jgi:hypothetical protein
MKLFSRRYDNTDGTASVSRLFIEDAYECFILEDKVHEPKERPVDPAQLVLWVKTWKVPGKTAIPSGTYEVRWTRSPKYSLRAGHDVFTLEIVEVPSFQGIRIHVGNDPEDTEGCQLPGRTHTAGSPFVGESTLALRALESKVCPVLARGEKVWITITNEFPNAPVPQLVEGVDI